MNCPSLMAEQGARAGIILPPIGLPFNARRRRRFACLAAAKGRPPAGAGAPLSVPA